MQIYTFTMISNDSDDFQAKITAYQDIKFIELHQAIQQALSYDPLQMASFFVCDEGWGREQEIALMDMDAQQDTCLMEEVSLADMVPDASKNLLYLYDFFSERFFHLILDSIENSEEATFSIDVSGTVPEQIKVDDEDFYDSFLETRPLYELSSFEDEMDFLEGNISLEDMDDIDDIENY